MHKDKTKPSTFHRKTLSMST